MYLSKKSTESMSVTTSSRLLITGDFSNSAELLKFYGKGEILRLCSKFCSPQKTVGPNDADYYDVLSVRQSLQPLPVHCCTLR